MTRKILTRYSIPVLTALLLFTACKRGGESTTDSSEAVHVSEPAAAAGAAAGDLVVKFDGCTEGDVSLWVEFIGGDGTRHSFAPNDVLEGFCDWEDGGTPDASRMGRNFTITLKESTVQRCVEEDFHPEMGVIGCKKWTDEKTLGVATIR